MAHCKWNSCNSNWRYRDRDHMKNVRLYPFPKPCKYFRAETRDPTILVWHDRSACKQCSLAMEWIRACKKEGFEKLEQITSSCYVCSKHFMDGKPTEINPCPGDANSQKMVSADQKLAFQGSIPVIFPQTTPISLESTDQKVHCSIPICDSRPAPLSIDSTNHASPLQGSIAICDPQLAPISLESSDEKPPLKCSIALRDPRPPSISLESTDEKSPLHCPLVICEPRPPPISIHLTDPNPPMQYSIAICNPRPASVSTDSSTSQKLPLPCSNIISNTPQISVNSTACLQFSSHSSPTSRLLMPSKETLKRKLDVAEDRCLQYRKKIKVLQQTIRRQAKRIQTLSQVVDEFKDKDSTGEGLQTVLESNFWCDS